MTYDEVARAWSHHGELVLRRRGPVLELRVNGIHVMDSAETGSELELARAALGAVDEPTDVLVAGLGLGFTAHEVLADRRVRRILVVELEEVLVDWMRDGTIPHGPSVLADERLQVKVADIRVAVQESAPASFDLMLLDVDNGPDHLVHQANAVVYEEDFLAVVRDTIKPGGALVVWSASESESLHHTIALVFGNCEALPHPVRLQTRDERYWLYLARRPA